jgi:hypothetical protein
MSFIKNLDSAIALHGIDNLDQIIHGKINVFNLGRKR